MALRIFLGFTNSTGDHLPRVTFVKVNAWKGCAFRHVGSGYRLPLTNHGLIPVMR